MPYRQDQLVGCLTDDMQNLDNDLEDLIDNPNQHQYNQYIVDSNQMSNQLVTNSNQFEVVQTTDFNQTNQFIDDTTTNFNFNTTDFDKNDYQAINFNHSNLNSFDIDDELELNHLKELEDLMDTNQPMNNQISSDQLTNSFNQQINNQLNSPLNTQQLNSPINVINNQRNSPISQLNQVNQVINNQTRNTNQPTQQRFLTTSSPLNQQAPTHLTFDNNFASSTVTTTNPASTNLQQATSNAQINARILNSASSNIQANSTVDDNSFLTNNVNSTPVNSTIRTCNNFLNTVKSTTNSFESPPPFNSSAPNTLSNYSQQMTNTSNVELGTYCDQLVNNNNLTNSLSSNNLQASNLRSPTSTSTNLQQSPSNNQQDTFFNQKQVFCQQDNNCDLSSPATMLESDLNSSNLLSSNLNCYVNQTNLLNQTNQLNNQLIHNNQMILNNQTNFTNSSSLQSPSNLQSLSTQSSLSNQSPLSNQSSLLNQTKMLSNQSPIKHLPQFKSTSSATTTHGNNLLNNGLSNLRSPTNEWLDTVANQVLQDMKRCGICVIDNFLGSSFCDTILNEVIEMYSDGYFKDGLLVGNKSNGDKNIRGDKINWVDGKESNCINIGYLMRTLDQVLMRFSRMNTDGCTILNRTKAMIACYPANGTKYVKHVDNPNQDGRYITCIYYLNKNWSSQRDGGMLRLFPKGMPYVANIEPLFDRVIFFWSDRRNPHEVMPSYSIRFAITLWYFNSKEREMYIKKIQNLQTNQPS